MGLKIIVTDSNSLAGSCIVDHLERQSFNAVFLTLESIDWQDPAATADCFALEQPDIVINCGLPGLYAHQPQFEVFANISESIARACLLQDIICLHLSSFEVYSATMRRPGEDDQLAPDSERARALIRADEAILAMNHSIVLRLGWLVGPNGDNILTRVLDELQSSKTLALNPVLRGSPTSFNDIARVLVAMIKQIDCGADNWGVMHYCAEGYATEFGLAEVIVNKMSALGVTHAQLQPLPETALPQFVPNRSGLLDVVRCTSNFGIQPPNWEQGVEDIVCACLRKEPRLTG